MTHNGEGFHVVVFGESREWYPSEADATHRVNAHNAAVPKRFSDDTGPWRVVSDKEL